MSNQRYEDNFYNEKVKNQFLLQFDDEQRLPREVIFRKSREIEEKFGKDLAKFDKEELEEFLYFIKPSTLNSVTAQLSLINSYQRWAKKKGHRLSDLPLEETSEQYKRQFIVEKTGRYLAKKELYKDIRLLKNPQDQIVMLLLFYGISGKSSNEIIGLRIEHCDLENRIIHVPDVDDNPRDIEIDEFTADILRSAINQKVYFKNNGKMVTGKAPRVAQLAETGYVVKPIKTNVKKFGEVKHNIIVNRIETFKEATNRANVTPLTIVQSGDIYEVFKEYKEKGIIDNGVYASVAEKRHFKPVRKPGHNWTKLKAYANLEIVKELYGEELQLQEVK